MMQDVLVHKMPIEVFVCIAQKVWNVVAVLRMAVKMDLLYSIKIVHRVHVLLIGNKKLVLHTAIIAHHLISKDTNIVYLILKKLLN